jgi:hypothetical protein
MAAFEQDDVEFSFEQQLPSAVKHIVPQADNLNLRSIHRKTVCRYWLNNKCRKGDRCEFKHEHDPENMPECRKGPSCPDPSCTLSHVTKDDRPLCANYEAGFCSFGHSCQYRHELKRDAPVIATMFFAADPVKQFIEYRKNTQRSFRRAECPYFQCDGWCPYFYACAFKHS